MISIPAQDYKSFFEKVPGLYLVLTPELTIVAASDAYLQATLTERDAIVGRGLFDAFPDNPDDHKTTAVSNTRASLNYVLQHGEPHAMAIQRHDVRGNDGQFIEKYWRPLNSPVFNEQNELVYIIHHAEDVTSRQKVEEKLKKSEKDYQLLVRGVKDYAIFMVDKNGLVASWNSGAELIKGYKAEEIIGQPIDVFYTAEEIQKGEPKRNLQMALQNGHFEIEGLRVRKDGSVFYANIVFASLLDDDGNLYGYAKVTRDITEKRKADDHIRFLASIADNIQDPVISSDNNFNITKWNKAAEKLLEWTAEEVLGRSATEILKTNYLSETREQRLDAFSKTGFWQGEVIYYTKSGKPLHALFTLSHLKDAEGNVTGNLILVRDISQRKLAEEKLLKFSQELEQKVIERTEEILKLNEELEQKVISRTVQLQSVNKELESFSYSVSHDLRAPLRIIDGFGQILLEDYSENLDEQGQKTINVIMKNARKMGMLIDDLLSFSKLGRSEMRISKVDMNDLVEEVLQELKTSGITIPVKLKLNKLRTARGDHNLLKQVWINLISNAIKYSGLKEDPIIEIGMLEKKDKHIYYVKDNGAGFDMKYADKLFGVFQRLHNDKEFTGTGVGLALVQRIILRHNGTIWAEAKENKGATFYFTLQEFL